MQIVSRGAASDGRTRTEHLSGGCGPEAPELLAGYVARIGRGGLLSHREEVALGRRAHAWDVAPDDIVDPGAVHVGGVVGKAVVEGGGATRLAVGGSAGRAADQQSEQDADEDQPFADATPTPR